MKNEQTTLDHISNALDDMMPENMYEKITDNINSKERTIIMTNQTTAQKKNVKIIIAVAACFLLAFGIFGTSYWNSNMKVESIVDIDINPSIEISTNKKDKVVKVDAINLDAEKVLDGMDLKGVDLDIAINAIVGSLVKNEYLTDGENNILVTVLNDDEEKAAHTRNLVLSDINSALKDNDLKAEVANQTIASNNDDASTFASEQNISVGKATLILNLCSKDSALDKNELAKMSLHEIANVISANDIDISDVVDYEADDTVWENVKDTVEEVDEEYEETTKKTEKNEPTKANETVTESKKTNETTTTGSKYISSDKAKEIALAKAGLSASSVTELKVELDDDDYITKYEVEFKANGYEYDYEINAKTGALIKADKEYDDDYVATTKKSSSSTTKASKETSKISADEAKQIALKNAGLSASNVTGLKAELDGNKYEVEFKANGYEYDFDINVNDGSIIKSDKERDDDYFKTTTKKSSSTTYISAAKAKEIALNHAGLKASEVTFIKAELDTEDDGSKEYEVEFISGKYEYEYKIDPVSGKILESDKEIDD